MYALGELGASEKTKKKRKKRRRLLKILGIGAAVVTAGVAATALMPALLPGAGALAKSGAGGLLATGQSIAPDVAKSLIVPVTGPEAPGDGEIVIPQEKGRRGGNTEASLFGISPTLLFTMGVGLVTMFFFAGKGRNA